MSLYYRAFVCLLWETAVGLILLLIHPQTPSSTLNSHTAQYVRYEKCFLRIVTPCLRGLAWRHIYVLSPWTVLADLLSLCVFYFCVQWPALQCTVDAWACGNGFHMPGNVTNLYFYCCDGQGTYYAFGIKGPFDSVEPSSPTYGAYRLP